MRESKNYWASGASEYGRYQGNQYGNDNREGMGGDNQSGGFKGENRGGFHGENRNYGQQSNQNSGFGGYGNPSNQRFGGSSPGMNPMGGGMNGPMGGGMGMGGGMSMPGMGPGGSGPMGMGPQGFGGFGNSGPRDGGNFVDSLRKISQMNSGGASELELASKIITAVLTGGAAQPGNQRRSRSPQYRGRDSSRRGRSPFNDRRGGPPPPRRRSVDRFSRSRRGMRRSPPRRRYEDRADFRRPFANRQRKRSRSREVSTRGKRPRRSISKEDADDDRDKGMKKREENEPASTSFNNEQEEGTDDDDDETKPKKIVLGFENEGEEKMKEEFPPAALFCHMCNHGGFASEKTYLFHLEGIRHRKTATAYHAKNEASLEYLRRNAKLASIRVGGLDSNVKPSKCTVCHAIVKENFHKHKKLLEHRLVKKFLIPKCCGRFFKNHHDMDEHKLSLPHLRKVFQSNEAKQAELETLSIDSLEAAIKAAALSANNDDTEVLEIDNLPPFDGNKMIGLKFLKVLQSITCEACQIAINSKGIEGHLISINHYNCLQDHLRALRKKAREEREKEQEGDADGVKKEPSDGGHFEKGSDDEEERKDSEDEGEFPFLEEGHIVLEESTEMDDLHEMREDCEDGGKSEDDQGKAEEECLGEVEGAPSEVEGECEVQEEEEECVGGGEEEEELNEDEEYQIKEEDPDFEDSKIEADD